MFLKHQISILE